MYSKNSILNQNRFVHTKKQQLRADFKKYCLKLKLTFHRFVHEGSQGLMLQGLKRPAVRKHPVIQRGLRRYKVCVY